jgi:hypothetical protein
LFFSELAKLIEIAATGRVGVTLMVKESPRDQTTPRCDHRQVDPLTAASPAIL